MKLPALLIAASAATIALLSTPADAQVHFTISGDYNASFDLPTAPVPDPAYTVDGYSFSIAGVSGTFGGSAGTADLTFFNRDATGGLLISSGFDFLFDANGFQLYRGTESTPIFDPNSFRLTGLSTPGDFLVTIAAAPVPEPASWAMMLGGFALAGGAMRTRRRLVKVHFQA